MSSFKFDRDGFTNKCKSSFINTTSDKTKSLWSPLQDNINCTCGKKISKTNISKHLKVCCHKPVEQPTLNTKTSNTLNVKSDFDAFKSITCICGKIELNRRLNNHLNSSEHFKLTNNYPTSITLNRELFKLCTTCNVYVNEYCYKKHITPECKFIKRKDIRYYKGEFKCLCGAILKDDIAYINHLPTEEHIAKFTKYLEKFDPWA